MGRNAHDGIGDDVWLCRFGVDGSFFLWVPLDGIETSPLGPMGAGLIHACAVRDYAR